eukprot:3677937-Rhodomonas_salina.2
MAFWECTVPMVLAYDECAIARSRQLPAVCGRLELCSDWQHNGQFYENSRRSVMKAICGGLH